MLCDCMFQRGLSLCRSALRTVCCYGLFPRGLCVHSSPKNRASLWQHRRGLTCDILDCFLSKRLTPSRNLSLFLRSFFLSLGITLTLVPPLWSDLFFFSKARIPIHSIISSSVWHTIGAVKTALTLDNTHFVGGSHCWLTGWKHGDTKTGLGYCGSTRWYDEVCIWGKGAVTCKTYWPWVSTQSRLSEYVTKRLGLKAICSCENETE